MTLRHIFPLALGFGLAGCVSAATSTGASTANLSNGSAATIVSAVGGRCLDDNGDATADGNKIQIWACNGTSAQTWKYENGALVGPGGKCLDVQWDNQANGTPVWLYTCNGGPAQQWTIDGTSIKSSAGYCLDVRDGVNADGTQVQLWGCGSGNNNQKWSVNGAATSAPPTTPPTTPVTSTPTTKAELLAYIESVQAKHKILLGEHSDYWPGATDAAEDYLHYIDEQTSDPVILGLGISGQGSPEGKYVVDLANEWIGKGGIVMVSTWLQQGAVPGWSDAQAQSVPNLGMSYDASTNQPSLWASYLDMLATTFKQINGPVIYRPFVEINGSWFWWGGQDPTTFKKLWVEVRQGLINRGVTNVLYLYNVNAGVGRYTDYYAGDEYVDIVSWDAYEPTQDGDEYTQLAALGKPIMLAETSNCGGNDVSCNQTPDAVVQRSLRAWPNVFAAVFWEQAGYQISQSSSYESGLLNDTAIVSLAK
jgi:hypothetical protein